MNQAFGSGRKANMKGIDHIVAFARARLESVSDHGEVSVLDDEGNEWLGSLHPEWI